MGVPLDAPKRLYHSVYKTIIPDETKRGGEGTRGGEQGGSTWDSLIEDRGLRVEKE
jgi:hypothetical protein